MGTLAAALAWAARGFRVFPLEENSKLPLSGFAWTEEATTDPEVIRSWWKHPTLGFEMNYNIGFCTTGWIVPDVDVKQGKRGLETFLELGLEFDSLTIQTASGGLHVVYRGIDRPVGQAPLGLDLDVRSYNGYVVAPGSSINNRSYKVIVDCPPAEFPYHLRHLLKAPRRRTVVSSSSIELDQPEFVEFAEHWLRTAAPKAIEGQNGDDTTYRVCCRVRDFGLSEETAYALLSEIWNPTCEPPWDPDELEHKVNNAYRYATSAPGAATPHAAFEGVAPVALPPLTAPKVNGHTYEFGNALPISEIPARPFVLGTLLLNRTVTAVIAAPGGGKSMLKLLVAAHLAMGKDFMGHRCFRPGKSIVFDAEDDKAELSRRLHAICTLYGFDFNQVAARVSLNSSEEILLQLTTPGPSPVINLEQVNALIERLKDPEVVMLAIGPLVELHMSNENDNMVMKYVMGVLRLIAQHGDVAVVVDHHTSKPPMASPDAWLGSQYAGRGGSSVPGAARRVITMFSATEKDCIDLNIPLEEHLEFVRLDDGKFSYGKRDGGPRWLRWHSVKLWNGDDVGVLKPYDVAGNADAATQHVGRMLISAIQMTGSAAMPIERALEVMQRDPLMHKEDRTVLKNRLERLFQTPVRVAGVEVLIMKVDGKNQVLIR